MTQFSTSVTLLYKSIQYWSLCNYWSVAFLCAQVCNSPVREKKAIRSFLCKTNYVQWNHELVTSLQRRFVIQSSLLVLILFKSKLIIWQHPLLMNLSKTSFKVIAQEIQCLTTGWTTGVRSPTGAKDFSSSLCVQTGSGAHPASYPMGTERGKARPGVTLTTHPHLVPRLSMSRSYTSSPPLCLHGV
jgi:hypothetical protein